MTPETKSHGRPIGIGREIARLRKQAGLTQSKLARAIGTESMTVSRWERGEHEISLTNLLKLADVLGVDAGTILSGVRTPVDPHEEA